MKQHRFGKNALCRKAAFLLMLVMLMSVFGMTASAESIQKNAYDTYNYWSAPGTRWTASSTPMYEYKTTVTGASLGISALKDPADVVTDDNGLIYIMDSGNGRVVVVNPDFTLNKIITGLSYQGEALDFVGATGIFVTADQTIYIADTEHARVIVTNLAGTVSNLLVLPSEDVIPDNFNYRPSKITVDSKGFTYVLSEGSYYGAILYKPDGSFSGFFGSNSVRGSILGIFEKLYERIFVSEAKKANAEKTLPYSFTDITVDNTDFVYTATGAVSTSVSNTGQLKKLSPGGTNVLKNKTTSTVTSAESTNFSDGRGVQYPSNSGYYEWRVTDVYSMDVDHYGYMYGLCRTYGHVLIYDQECNQISVFGGGLMSGNQKGTFSRPSSIQIDDTNQNVLVLDSLNLSLTVYSETEYGKLVKQAQDLTTSGSYVEAKPYWEKALSYDRNQQLAYRGLARAALIEEDYELTLQYAKMGYDQDTYASAFTYVRNDYLSRNFIWLFLLLIVVVGGLIAFLVYTNKHQLKLIKNVKVSTMFQCMFHPFQGAQQVRYYNNGSTVLATVLLAIYFITSVCAEIYSGFMHSLLDKSTYSAGFTLIRSVGIVLLWTVVNWALSTLFQGKGKMKHVYIVTCYALLPLIIGNICNLILTNVLTPEEALLITAINTVCTALAGIILCVGTMTVHEFGFFKFLVMTLVVLFGMMISIFVILMVFVLIQQMISFITTIYKEISYR